MKLRAGALAVGLLAPGAARAGQQQLFVEADLLWTLGGSGHPGVGLGAHYSYLPLEQAVGPDLGAFVQLRWMRFAYLSATAGARVGAALADTGGGGGYQPYGSATGDVGWTVRTRGGSGLTAGGGVAVLWGQVRVESLVVPVGAAPERAAEDGLPIPRWNGTGRHDPTVSLGGRLWLLPQYYLLFTDDVMTVPETTPSPGTGTPR